MAHWVQFSWPNKNDKRFPQQTVGLESTPNPQSKQVRLPALALDAHALFLPPHFSTVRQPHFLPGDMAPNHPAISKDTYLDSSREIIYLKLCLVPNQTPKISWFLSWSSFSPWSSMIHEGYPPHCEPSTEFPCKERTRWAPRRPNATAASKTATCRGRSLNPGYFGLTEDKLEEWSMFLNVTCKHGVWTMLKIRLKDLHNITGRTIQNWGADWDWSWHYLKWPHNLARPRSKRSIPLISSFYFSCNSMIPHIRRDFICWISATPSNWVSPLGHSWSISGCSVTYHLPAGFRKTPWTPLPPKKMVRSSFVLARP